MRCRLTNPERERTMKLSALIDSQMPDSEISALTDNSKKITDGCLFFCIKGRSFDGHELAAQALADGAAYVVCERNLGLGDRQIIVPSTREAYGKACAAWFGHPEKKLRLVGVTGTNGKTTMTGLIKYILTSNGHKTGLIGTIQNEIGDEILPACNTTPMPFEFMELLDKMVRAGCEYAVMEVSSFGLSQKRLATAWFDIAVFTNLTPDHLDYHNGMEDYYSAKRLLFDICDIALCNIDDQYGRRLYDEISCGKYTYSIKCKADFYADAVKSRSEGSSFWFCTNEKSHYVTLNMPGLYNVENATAAIGVCIKLGIPAESVIAAVAEYSGTRGRCEIIPTNRDFTVICDYAHTPDALENILGCVREFTEGRLICLFGCGGNRDTAKRPLMAQAAEKYSDIIIVTSDNPRDEEPESIISDILSGFSSMEKVTSICDRTDAINYALREARRDDVIVLAGKGHEDYQVLPGGVKIHYDEREIVAQGIKSLK